MKSTNFVREFNIPVHSVWALLDDFGRLDWLPKAHTLKVVGNGSPGTVRIIEMEGAEPCWEVLLAKDVANMTLSYAVPTGLQVAVSNYSASMRLEPLSEGRTRLYWYSHWEAEDGAATRDAADHLRRIYTLLTDGIEAVLLDMAQSE